MKPFTLTSSAVVPDPPSSIRTTKSPVAGADAGALVAALDLSVRFPPVERIDVSLRITTIPEPPEPADRFVPPILPPPPPPPVTQYHVLGFLPILFPDFL